MERVRRAASNNADLYEAVCAAHGCRTERTDSMLLCLDQPPRFYSQAVTLGPDVGEQVAERVTGGFKDSFCDVEPEKDRYEVLFTASWIWGRAPTERSPKISWRRVTSDAELALWERAWATGDDTAIKFPPQFPPELLSHPGISFTFGHKNEEVVAGAMFNESGAVVGISNSFATGIELDELWSDLSVLTAFEYPGRAITGYLRDSDLEAALENGFEAIGPLRIYVRVGAE